MKRLTKSQWEALDIQFSRTPSIDDTFSASGEHYILISLLNSFGHHPRSAEEAMNLAEELLSRGYDE
jgi:hypothetical protein